MVVCRKIVVELQSIKIGDIMSANRIKLVRLSIVKSRAS